MPEYSTDFTAPIKAPCVDEAVRILANIAASQGIPQFIMVSNRYIWMVMFESPEVWSYTSVNGGTVHSVRMSIPTIPVEHRKIDNKTRRKSKNPKSNVMKKSNPELMYVAVDEKGNLGKSTINERYYDIVATVVRDRTRFENVSKPYVKKRGREIKYHDDEDLHEPVIKKAAPYVSNTYYAKYYKNPTIHRRGLSKEEKVDVHLDMLCSVADEVIRQEGFDHLDVDIDYNRMLAGIPVEKSFECSPFGDGKGIHCRVVDSKLNYGAITNDFIVGAVGDFVNNRGDSRKTRGFKNE